MSKRILSVLICVIIAFALTSCGKKETTKTKTEEVQKKSEFTASKDETEQLEAMYVGTTVFHGEMHDHSASGGTSDGHYRLFDWKRTLNYLKLDFAAILDHKQILHMYSSDWQPNYIGGSEAASSSIAGSKLHYNMVFAEPEGFLRVINQFPEFEYTGGTDGHFKYTTFSRERFMELSDCIRENGGYLVIPHPKSSDCVPASQDPLCYWYGDYNGLEVLYQQVDSVGTPKNYELWKQLLALDKRLYVCAGGDGHRKPDTEAMTTVYTATNNAADIFSAVKVGHSTAGGAGIRMVMGDTVTGGHKSFGDNEKLILAAGDFHKDTVRRGFKFYFRVYEGEKVVLDEPIDTASMNYFSIPVNKDAPYYRAEIYGIDKLHKDGLIFAYGNPIWNDK